MDRYERHRSLMSDEAWNRLRSTGVGIVGVGGLGCAVASLLSRIGPICLDLWDPGVVDDPDLNRQLLYGTADVGTPKVTAAARRIGAINPDVAVREHPEALTATAFGRAIRFGTPMTIGTELSDGSAGPVIESTVLFDCVDNIESRREIETLRRQWLIPVFHGAVDSWWGQVATLLANGGGYESVYGESWSRVASGEGGGRPIMPHVVTMVASAQVGEFVRWLEDPTQTNTSSGLWYVDGRNLQTSALRVWQGSA